MVIHWRKQRSLGLWLLMGWTAFVSFSTQAAAQPDADAGSEQPAGELDAALPASERGIPEMGDLSELGAPPPPPGSSGDADPGASRQQPRPTPPEPSSSAGDAARDEGEEGFAPQIDAVCRTPCRREGTCRRVHGACIAESDAQCEPSEICRRHGRCAAVEGECRAAVAGHCLRSWSCLEDGECELDYAAGRCVEAGERNSRAMMGLGIASIAVGGAMSVIAGPMALVLSDRDKGPGIALIVAGGTAVAVGIPLTVYGARRKDADEPPEGGVALTLAPTSVGLRGTF